MDQLKKLEEAMRTNFMDIGARMMTYIRAIYSLESPVYGIEFLIINEGLLENNGRSNVDIAFSNFPGSSETQMVSRMWQELSKEIWDPENTVPASRAAEIIDSAISEASEDIMKATILSKALYGELGIAPYVEPTSSVLKLKSMSSEEKEAIAEGLHDMVRDVKAIMMTQVLGDSPVIKSAAINDVLSGLNPVEIAIVANQVMKDTMPAHESLRDSWQFL